MSTWIFQGNPATFRINDAVKELEWTTWLVKVHHGKMRPRDTVYLWRSAHDGEPAGVIAKTEMQGTVIPMFSPHEIVAYWVDPEIKNSREDRVRLNILERCSETREMITREAILDDEILKTMLVIRQPHGTNFLLSDEHVERLEELWNQ
jgi:hypothetical protein